MGIPLTLHPLTFLVTSHIDPEGYRHLLDALEDLCPGIILLEVSLFSLLFRKTLGRIYRAILAHRVKTMRLVLSPELKNALNYLDVPCEYRAAREYSRKTCAKIILLDISRFSFLQLLHAHEIITRRNIETLSIINADRFAMEKALARRIFIEGDDALADVKARAFQKGGAQAFARFRQGGTPGDDHDRRLATRESILAERVSSRVKKYRGRRIVYIGGWEHCIDDPKKRTLYSRIDGPKERRIVFLEG
jgi:hypothetical protein